MKLNNKRTILIGFAFLSICAFWQMYDNLIPLILTNTFHMNETLSGAIMALGLMSPVDENDPVGSKKRTVALSRELQKRFSAKFGALRCQDLLRNKSGASDATSAAQRLGLTGHCDVMVVTAVEIVEELLAERG